MINLTIGGNIGGDAEVRTTQSGKKVTGFSVAVTKGFGDSKKTVWVRCSWWGGRGEKLAKYLTKGSKVVVSGDADLREYEGKTSLELNVSDVTLMGGGQDRQSQGGTYGDQRQEQGGEPANFDDSEIPFSPQVL